MHKPTYVLSVTDIESSVILSWADTLELVLMLASDKLGKKLPCSANIVISQAYILDVFAISNTFQGSSAEQPVNKQQPSTENQEIVYTKEDLMRLYCFTGLGTFQGESCIIEVDSSVQRKHLVGQCQLSASNIQTATSINARCKHSQASGPCNKRHQQLCDCDQKESGQTWQTTSALMIGPIQPKWINDLRTILLQNHRWHL